eukprot:Nk52_evm10s150 gene=Nk52_evmTU10s150
MERKQMGEEEEEDVGVGIDPVVERERHLMFIKALERAMPERFEYWITEHLRLTGVYYGMCATHVLGRPLLLCREEILAQCRACQVTVTGTKGKGGRGKRREGGFGGNPGHDPHIQHTLSALQLCALILHGESQQTQSVLCGGVSGKDIVFDPSEYIDVDRALGYVLSLYDEEGGFFVGDKWGGVDTRYCYCALQALHLLRAARRRKQRGHVGGGGKERERASLYDYGDEYGIVLDREKIIGYLLDTMNVDGGFGSGKGCESHAGQIFCVLGSLCLLEKEQRANDKKDKEEWGEERLMEVLGSDGILLLRRWLCERQVKVESQGGMCGRVGKDADTCYTWWTLASLAMLERAEKGNLRDQEGSGMQTSPDYLEVVKYVMRCESREVGGFGPRIGAFPDMFHTFFSLVGLDLLPHLSGFVKCECVGELSSSSPVGDDCKKCREKWNFGMKENINPVYCLPQSTCEWLFGEV